MSNIGHLSSDKTGLPCFEYTGNIPYSVKLENGTDVKLPEDPWFLLGNYRFTLFTHISGEYELISGQRSWARVNQGKRRNSGVNLSAITVDDKNMPLLVWILLLRIPKNAEGFSAAALQIIPMKLTEFR